MTAWALQSEQPGIAGEGKDKESLSIPKRLSAPVSGCPPARDGWHAGGPRAVFLEFWKEIKRNADLFVCA